MVISFELYFVIVDGNNNVDFIVLILKINNF